MNLHKITERLQTALCRRGRMIRINQRQYYSKTTGRRGTMYTVCESVVDEETGKKKTEVYCTTTRMVEVVLALRELYEGGE